MTPPVFAHGHLRLYLLSLLAESESGMHGYELIQALGDRFGGTYVPSAGTIYPRLAKLEDESLVTKAADGRKTVYAITEAGRAELAARQSELDGIEEGVTDSVRRLADEVRSSVTDAMRTLRADLAAATREARTESRASGRSMRADTVQESSASKLHLSEAESILNTFRAELRSDLRVHVAQGELTAETIETLKTALADVRAGVKATLR